jgi:hypothetical protein
MIAVQNPETTHDAPKNPTITLDLGNLSIALIQFGSGT